MYQVHCYGDCKVAVYGQTKQQAIERWNAMTKEEAKKKFKNQTLTGEELAEYLDKRIADGEITKEEAEDEYQDYMHRWEHWQEW